MNRFLVTLLALVSISGCLPEDTFAPSAINLQDMWVYESGSLYEVLDLQLGKFTYTKKIAGATVDEPISGRYQVLPCYDYGKKWYVLILKQEDKTQPVQSFKITLTHDKKLLTLEGATTTAFYRVERTRTNNEEESKG